MMDIVGHKKKIGQPLMQGLFVKNKQKSKKSLKPKESSKKLKFEEKQFSPNRIFRNKGQQMNINKKSPLDVFKGNWMMGTNYNKNNLLKDNESLRKKKSMKGDLENKVSKMYKNFLKNEDKH